MTDNEPDQPSDASTDLVEENVCPPGFIWDPAKGLCVPIIIDDDED